MTTPVDELMRVMIEGNFYSALKEYGMPTARFANGKYKDTQAQAMWIAYLCGKYGMSAQHVMSIYPDCQDQPHES